MIRFIVSDVDGTLLRLGETQISLDLISVIQSLVDRGIQFAIASGRPYYQLRRLFEPVQRELFFLASDGAVVLQGTHRLWELPLPKGVINTCIALPQVQNELFVADGCYHSYAYNGDEKDRRLLEEERSGQMKWMYPGQLPDADIFKLSLSRRIPDFTWEQQASWRIRKVYDGPQWSDYVPALVSKGASLRRLMREYSLDRSEVAALGDGYNDLEMLREAGRSFAPYEASAMVRRQCGAYFRDSLEVLRDFL